VRAPCRTCRRDSAVTTRGRVWTHHALPRPEECPGSRLPPLGEPWLREARPLPGQWVSPPPWQRESRDPAGTVYLLHFAEPFSHARHYLGWAAPGNLSARLAHHAAGTGANLLRHVGKAGIGWELARTWPGDRTLERRLKNRGGHARLCPACAPARPAGQPGIGGRIIGGPVDAGSHARRTR
jgi:hypothetical protein